MAIALAGSAAAGTLTPEQQVGLVYQTASVLPAGTVDHVDFGYAYVDGEETFRVTLSGLDVNTLAIWTVEDFYFEDYDEGGLPTLLARTHFTEELLDADNTRTRFHYDLTPFDGTFPSSAEGTLLDGELFGFQVDRQWNQGYFAGAQSVHLAISSGAYTVDDLPLIGDLVSTSVIRAIEKEDDEPDWTVLAGEPDVALIDHLDTLDDLQPQQGFLSAGSFWACMSDCRSPIGLAKRITQISLMGVGIAACVAGGLATGGLVVPGCVAAFIGVWSGGVFVDGFGFFACTLYCLKQP